MLLQLALPPAQGLALHQVFEVAALFIGARYYFWLRKRGGQAGATSPGSFAVLVGCLAGAGLGNKALFWIENPQLLPTALAKPWLLLMGGQSVVGGLLGGLLGVELAKALTGQRQSTGDWFVRPILLGLFIGRIGCLLAGLQDGTYGSATALPWAVDFGDGIGRHPAPVYEMLWCVAAALLLQRWRPRLAAVSGLEFKLMLSAYLLWRLLSESWKPVPYAYALGLSGIQWACVIALLVYLPITLLAARRLP